jgi:hypothetical protein
MLIIRKKWIPMNKFSTWNKIKEVSSERKFSSGKKFKHNSYCSIGAWFLNNRNFKLFLTNTNVTSRSLNTSWSIFIDQLVNTFVKWYRKSGISYHEWDSNDMESKTETNLLAQIVIKGNLNINSILYKQHNFILNKVPGFRCSLL